MNWFSFGIDMAFSVVFSLLASGVIPAEHYRKFRKLAVRILSALPDIEAETVMAERSAKVGKK